MSSQAQHVTSANPLFDFEQLLKASLDRSDKAQEYEYFSLSPLSSAPNSPAQQSSRQADFSDLSDLTDLELEQTPAEIPASLSSNSQLEPQPPAQPVDRKAKKKANSKRNKRKRREQEREQNFGLHSVRDNVLDRYVNPAKALFVPMDASDASVTTTAFTGLDDGSGLKRRFTLQELIGEGSRFRFKLHEWDGRTPIPIVDLKGRIIGILAGQPDDPDWAQLCRDGADAMEKKRAACNVPKPKRPPRRGAFVALQCGLSHGGGQTAPVNVSNDPRNAQILKELNGMEAFKRMAGFASSIMATWAPELYDYYVEKLGALYAHDPTLKRNFTSSVFAASTYNFGPRTECFKHIDFANLPYGWCAITALGSFDHKKGGHLVLWDCHLVIEFPPGSTILIPSGAISHSNTSIGPNEKRFSFTQYTAGGLFRWVENHFQKGTEYYASLSEEELATRLAEDAARWEFGLSLLPVPEM